MGASIATSFACGAATKKTQEEPAQAARSACADAASANDSSDTDDRAAGAATLCMMLNGSALADSEKP